MAFAASLRVAGLDGVAGIAGAAGADALTHFRTDRHDGSTGVLKYSAAQAEAFEKLDAYYAGFFGTPDTRFGLRPSDITDPQQIKQLTAFFSWSAWAGAALRPSLVYILHQHWPLEPLVGNHPTADAIVCSVLSLIALLGVIGLLLAVFGKPQRPSVKNLGPVLRVGLWNIERALEFRTDPICAYGHE